MSKRERQLFLLVSFLSSSCHSCASRNPLAFLLEKRKVRQKKTGERLQRGELCNALEIVLNFYTLEKFLKWGLGRDFFQKVPPQ